MNNNQTELISQILNGDESAFRKFVEMYQTQVFNVSLGFLGNKEDAEDLTQEVFIHILNKLSSFREESKLSTWIYRITVNKCLELIRARKRKKRWASLIPLWGDDSDRQWSSRELNHPGILLENKERAAILQSKIDELPENQKIAFTLHKYEALSYTEIAELMKLSLSSVESLMHRAKKNLKEKLRNYYEAGRK